jgi:SOS-response transcriptional repressor LexA
VSLRTYNGWERGESFPRVDAIEALSKTLDVDLNWLLLGKKKSHPLSSVEVGQTSLPLLGQICCGFEGVTNEALTDADRRPVPQSWITRGGYCLVYAVGESMEEEGIHDGDLVALTRVSSDEIQPDGKTIYALLTWIDQDCQGVSLKKLAAQDGDLWAIPAKQGLLPRRLSQLGDRVKVFARVIGVIRDLE